MPVSRRVSTGQPSVKKGIVWGKLAQISFKDFKRKKGMSRFNETNTGRIYLGLRDKNKIFATGRHLKRQVLEEFIKD